MHLIDQDLSGINQLAAIVAAISGYLWGKHFGQLCLTAGRRIICCGKKKKKAYTTSEISPHYIENEGNKHPRVTADLQESTFTAEKWLIS